MSRLDIEVRSPGVKRPAMRAHSSIQMDEWTADYHTREERDRFVEVVLAFLDEKVIGRQYGDHFVLHLNKPLTDEEAEAIRMAADELIRRRFKGDDAPKTMHECLHG